MFVIEHVQAGDRVIRIEVTSFDIVAFLQDNSQSDIMQKANCLGCRKAKTYAAQNAATKLACPTCHANFLASRKLYPRPDALDDSMIDCWAS